MVENRFTTLTNYQWLVLASVSSNDIGVICMSYILVEVTSRIKPYTVYTSCNVILSLTFFTFAKIDSAYVS